jgi:23S rRNA (cytosine1962-C5)-methyltransferase
VEIDTDFFRLRVAASVERRKKIFGGTLPSACRLVFGESDGLPGLVVDKYAGFLVCQFHAAGVEAHRASILHAIREAAPFAEGVYERSDSAMRARDGLPPAVSEVIGAAPPPELEIEEHGLRFLVDVKEGHKTGFYLDQRLNRALIAEYSRGAEVLNAFSYTGGFAVSAMRGGAARVTNVDTSGVALDWARRNAELNNLDVNRLENIEGDVFRVLREFRDCRRQFDLIVLDPPKFAETKAHVERACRGYKDINLLAFKLLRPGGVLFTLSCSGGVDEPLFQKIVADAALDACRDARMERRMTQAPDHPVLMSFPESAYLKGIVCRAD